MHVIHLRFCHNGQIKYLLTYLLKISQQTHSLLWFHVKDSDSAFDILSNRNASSSHLFKFLDIHISTEYDHQVWSQNVNIANSNLFFKNKLNLSGITNIHKLALFVNITVSQGEKMDLLSACSKKLDVIFLVDSTQYFLTNWELMELGLTNIVKTIDNAFPIRQNDTNIGVITFDDTAHTVLSLTDGTSLQNVRGAINSMNPSNSNTSSLKNGLNQVLDSFSTLSRNRTTGTFMIVIIVINSEIISEGPTVALANQMKSQNIIPLVIALSPEVQYDTIRQIATNPDEAVYEPYSSLPLLWNDVDDLKTKVCPYPVSGEYVLFRILLLFGDV